MLLSVTLVTGWAVAIFLALLDGRRPGIGRMAVWCQVLILGMLIWLLMDVARSGVQHTVTGGWPAGIGIRLRGDLLGLLFATVSTAVLLAAMLYEVSRGVVSRTFPSLVLFLGTGLCGLFLTGDVFNFYVFFEISMVSAFALASYGERRAEIRTAAIFTMVNLLGSAFLLMSVAAIYRLTGTLDMKDIASALAGRDEPWIIVALLFAAFSLKLGLFPFHYWLPAVYRDARPAVAAILAGAVANIGSYGFLRFGAQVLSPVLESGQTVVLTMGTASMVYGGLLAVGRQPAVEVLAYSSISQVGYILMALGIGGSAGTTAAVFYSLVNALNKAALFIGRGLRGGLALTAFAVGGISVAGVPPSAGFWAKLAIFRAALEQHNVWLPFVVLMGSALSFVYMFQTFQRLFLTEEKQVYTGPASVNCLMAVLSGWILALGVFPDLLITLSGHAAAQLLHSVEGPAP
ncbi:complex I subunit 5 family protein [Nitrospira sp. T9]|uniref:complex I subunit 5 family protein n=1 Tax=unclassified Nitrospira TaxID=2652172 RepID=UPI003F963CB8